MTPEVVPGTKSPKIRSDANFFSDAGLVHRGFLTALFSVWPLIVRTLFEFRTEKQAVWLCGHSLGTCTFDASSCKSSLLVATPTLHYY